MAVPNLDRAIIEPNKLARYLLNREHARGGSKARFFLRFGFTATSPEALAAALLAQARSAGEVTVETRSTGVFYIAIGEIDAPDGRRPSIRSVWEIRTGETAPRLVTAFRHRLRR